MFALFVLFLISALFLVFRLRRCYRTFAFFHPYCNAGGGGERVLWRAIAAMQRHPSLKHYQILIFTGDVGVSPEQILEDVSRRFNIRIDHPERLKFVYLRLRWLLEPKRYSHFTLLGQQGLGGLALGMEALIRSFCSPSGVPGFFLESTGVPITLPLFRCVAGSNVLCYIHYPTITEEMLRVVSSRTVTYNNSHAIASSGFYSSAKIVYYRAFAAVYSFCGWCCALVMVNGSWTADHIRKLWALEPSIVYPPCSVERLLKLESDGAETLLNEQKEVNILSVGQIRPEKDHLLQLRLFAAVKRLAKEELEGTTIRLLIAGGCRNAEDEALVAFLKNYARGNFGREFNTERDILWHLNIPFGELIELHKKSLIALHTMWNEHFGISVVEGMAAGNVMVANNSGGPKLDIIRDFQEGDQKRAGFLASTEEEYARAIVDVIKKSAEERAAIRQTARSAAKRFSEQVFDEHFCAAIETIAKGTSNQ